MTDRAAALELLRLALGDATAEFRDGQWEAIDALVNRRERLLVVQRTGWGKSSVYFISTRILRDRGRGPTFAPRRRDRIPPEHFCMSTCGAEALRK